MSLNVKGVRLHLKTMPEPSLSYFNFVLRDGKAKNQSSAQQSKLLSSEVVFISIIDKYNFRVIK